MEDEMMVSGKKWTHSILFHHNIDIFFIQSHAKSTLPHVCQFSQNRERHTCLIFSCVLSKYVHCSILNNKHCYRQLEINVLYLFFLFKYVGLNTTYPCQRLTNYEEWIQQQHNLFQNWNDGIVLIMEEWI